MNQTISREDRNWAIYAYAAGLLAFTNIPFANLIAQIVIWVKVRNDETMPLARSAGAAALNFQATWTLFYFLYAIGAMALVWYEYRDPVRMISFDLIHHGVVWLICGCFVFLAVNAAISILGCARASSGRIFRAPAIPFVR